MAARRLLIVMLILLGISSALAIVLPKPGRDDPPPEKSAATGANGATGTTGADEKDDASGESSFPDADENEEDADAKAEAGSARYESVRLVAGKPVEIEARPGSRLVLTVKSQEGSAVEIEGLGLTGFADPYAPAIFDLILPSEPGRYAVSAPGAKPSAVIDTRP
jgi:hypothetical protein